ncbi:MAG: asparagine synthase-related protein [Desulfovibrionaceae bacterium]
MAVGAFLPSEARQWAHAGEQNCEVWIAGTAIADLLPLRGEPLARHILEQILSGRDLTDLLTALRGHYALVLRRGEMLCAATDPIRSIPLFYRTEGPDAGVSDDAWTLRVADGLSRESVAEFSTAGFVTGPHTLFENVRTLQAGEIVRMARGQAVAERYYDYRCTYAEDGEDATAVAALDKVIMSCMGRAVAACKGRQAVIPLSGGLDSRLIASCFKRLGHPDVVCFAYGLPGNWEAEISRAKAKALGLPWFFVPYTPEMLSRHYHSAEMRRFWRFAAQGSALPSIPEWPALREVTEQGLIKPDAVFLSGQSGDFINGSHLKYLFDPAFCDDPLNVEQAIIDKHYTLWRDLVRESEVMAPVRRRIRDILAGFPLATPEQAACAYEYWECQERQLKYVVGGGRVFEFFGHEWWMPLWDVEIMDFFKQISIGLKLGGYLYAKCLAAHDPFGVFAENAPKSRFDRRRAQKELQGRETPRRKLKALLGNLPGLRAPLEQRRWQKEHRHYYRHSPLGFPRIYSEREYVYKDPAKRHVLSLWLRDFLREEHGVDLSARDFSTTG